MDYEKLRLDIAHILEKLDNIYTKSEMDKKFSEMDKKFDKKLDNLQKELKSEINRLDLQMQQVANRPSTNTSFAEGLSTAAAIGATPVRFNPSYLRWAGCTPLIDDKF